MGIHISETAIVNYRLSFANQGKQTSVFRFLFVENKRKFAVAVLHLQQTNESCHFPLVPFSVCTHGNQYLWKISRISVFPLKWQHIYIYMSIYMDIFISMYIHLYPYSIQYKCILPFQMENRQ
jgi:hypothetical protein